MRFNIRFFFCKGDFNFTYVTKNANQCLLEIIKSKNNLSFIYSQSLKFILSRYAFRSSLKVVTGRPEKVSAYLHIFHVYIYKFSWNMYGRTFIKYPTFFNIYKKSLLFFFFFLSLLMLKVHLRSMIAQLISQESHDCWCILFLYYSLYIPRLRRCNVGSRWRISRGISLDLTVIESLREFFRWRSSLSSSSRSVSTPARLTRAVYTRKSVRIRSTYVPMYCGVS